MDLVYQSLFLNLIIPKQTFIDFSLVQFCYQFFNFISLNLQLLTVMPPLMNTTAILL